MHGPQLQVVFEDNRIWHMLAGCYFDRSDGVGDGLVREYIIRVGRLFDPEWVNVLQGLAHLERLGQRPLLVGVEHDRGLVTHRLTHCGGAA